jgi:hypothetical protein
MNIKRGIYTNLKNANLMFVTEKNMIARIKKNCPMPLTSKYIPSNLKIKPFLIRTKDDIINYVKYPN